MFPCAASIARDDRGALLLLQPLGQRARAVHGTRAAGAAAAGAAAFGRRVNSRSAAVISVPRARMSARSMTFSSSRTLPGQA